MILMSFQKLSELRQASLAHETWWRSTDASCCGTGSRRTESPEVETEQGKNGEATRLGSLISTYELKELNDSIGAVAVRNSTDSWDHVCGSLWCCAI